MKYSFMSFSAPELELREMLQLAQKLGYDGIEPRVGSGHRHGIELDMSAQARKEAHKIAEDSPVKLCCLSTSVVLAGKDKLLQNMDDARRAIELCAQLGIPGVRIFGGKLDEGCSREAAVEQVARALETLSGEIGGENVSLNMETHDDWCDPKHVKAVMERCGGNHVGVNWDIMHPVLTAHVQVEEAFRLLAPYICHVHIHDGDRPDGKTLVFLPIGEGKVDHTAAAAALLQSGYDGYLSGEWISWNHADHLALELAAMKRIEEKLCTR